MDQAYDELSTYVCQLTFLAVVHAGNGDLTLGDVVVVVDVVRKQTFRCQITD